MRRIKDVPTCHCDLQIISPPNFSAIILHIWSPRPIPFVLIWLVSSRNPNSLNNLFKSFSFIPIPESSTTISRTPCFAFYTISTKLGSSGYYKLEMLLITFPFTLTNPPLLVNFKALDIRFRIIWDNLY